MKEEKKINGEKLGMTREIKFKEIQEAIDREEKKAEKKGKPKKKVEHEQDKEIVVKKVRPMKDSTEEDYFLTQSFKPVKGTKKIRKGIINFFLSITILSLLTLIAFFFIYPIVDKCFLLTPKEVFESSIEEIANNLKIEVDEEFAESIYFNTIFKIDTNMKEYVGFTDYEYLSTFGVDTNEKKDLFTFSIKDKEQVYGLNIIHNEKGSYVNLTNNPTFYDISSEEDEKDMDELKELVKQTFTETKAYNIIVEKEAQFFKELLKEENLSKKQDELYAFEKKTKVTRYTFQLEGNEVQSFFENHDHLALQDEEYMKNLSIWLEEDLETLKKEVSEPSKATFQRIAFNLYYQNGNEFVGFDIEVDGFRSIYYYAYDQHFILHADLNQIDKLFEDEKEIEEQEEDSQEELGILEIKGTKEEAIKAEIEYKEKKIAILDIRTLSNKKIDLSFNFPEEERTGELQYTEEKNKGSLVYTTRKDEKYITFTMQYSITNTVNIMEVPEANVVPFAEEQFGEELTTYMENFPDIILSLAELFKYPFEDDEPVREPNNPIIEGVGEDSSQKDDTIL